MIRLRFLSMLILKSELKPKVVDADPGRLIE